MTTGLSCGRNRGWTAEWLVRFFSTAFTAFAHLRLYQYLGVCVWVCLCVCECVYVGVDQKVLARSYVFGDHLSWLKSLRERSAMEFGDGVRDGGLPVHLHICRPRSLVDREIRSTYTCILDSLPALGMVQINNVGWAILEQVSRKIRERPAKGQGACCKVPHIAGKRKWQGE